MNLIDSYNLMTKERHQELTDVQWIESHLIYMGIPIKLSTAQKYILEADSFLINQHLPRAIGKTFALCTYAIKKMYADQEDVLYVGYDYATLKKARETVINILRASKIQCIYASDYVSFSNARITFCNASQVSFESVKTILVDEANFDPQLPNIFKEAHFIVVGSSKH